MPRGLPLPSPDHYAKMSLEDLKVGIVKVQDLIGRVRILEEFEDGSCDATAVAALQAIMTATLAEVYRNAAFCRDSFTESSKLIRGGVKPVMVRDVSTSQVKSLYLNGGYGKRNAIKVLQKAARSMSELIHDSDGADRGSTASTERGVFVVHGHDDGACNTVARFLERIGLEAIILHEQASQGRTIIEKFEAYSAVTFAIVLLTPDDVGGQVGAASSPRARQNVLFEWGFFLGRLGRDRVSALVKGDVELPSDIHGVVRQLLDAQGAWKGKLAQELAAASFVIDWSKVH